MPLIKPGTGGSSIVSPFAIERTVSTALLGGQTETLIEVTGKGMIDEALVYYSSSGGNANRVILEVDGVEVFNHAHSQNIGLSGISSSPPSINSGGGYSYRTPNTMSSQTSNVGEYNPAPTSNSTGRIAILTKPIIFKSSVRLRFKNEHSTNGVTERRYSLKGAYTT